MRAPDIGQLESCYLCLMHKIDYFNFYFWMNSILSENDIFYHFIILAVHRYGFRNDG